MAYCNCIIGNEVAKPFYTKFLPAVVEAATAKSPELKKKYQEKVTQLLARDENRWIKGLSPEEAAALKKSYKERYNQ
jgi:hypothetical protein